MLPGRTRERQFRLLRRPTAHAVRLHVDLMHLLALTAAVFIRTLQTGRFDLAPWRHAAADLRGDGVAPITGWRYLGDRCACSEHGQRCQS